MRLFNEYDYVFCDIDDTLIYGPWTDFMRHSWDIIPSTLLSKIAMWLQATFCLYNINFPLLYRLENTCAQVIFLTARIPSSSTDRMIEDIMSNRYKVVALSCGNPAYTKPEYIYKNFVSKGKKCLLIDDEPQTREIASELDIDVLNARLFLEKKVG